jgi:hypothetical protein
MHLFGGQTCIKTIAACMCNQQVFIGISTPDLFASMRILIKSTVILKCRYINRCKQIFWTVWTCVWDNHCWCHHTSSTGKYVISHIEIVFFLPPQRLWYGGINNSPVCMCVSACAYMCVCVCFRLYIELLKKMVSPNSTKLGRLVRWVKGFQNCSKNLIICRNLVSMATKRIYKKKRKESSQPQIEHNSSIL